jgi:predicted 2-oxoglutarate/Fe(II)-dependent dioxygenase YbiX
MDRGTPEEAEILGPSGPAAVRRALVIEPGARVLEMVEGRLDGLRPTVEEHFGMELHGREGPGFVRYHPGGFYLPHRDVAPNSEWERGPHRRISLVVFLNSGDFTGGDLVIFPSEAGDAARIAPEEGCLVAFDANLLHEVEPVGGGIRDVIVDWFG